MPSVCKCPLSSDSGGHRHARGLHRPGCDELNAAKRHTLVAAESIRQPQQPHSHPPHTDALVVVAALRRLRRICRRGHDERFRIRTHTEGVDDDAAEALAPLGRRGRRLRGRVAVLIGARTKGGCQIGVRMLRCGATLLATSRFPANALLRYQSGPDCDSWKANLHSTSATRPRCIYALGERIKATVTHVDILIDNAAQSIRRPLSY